MDGTVIALATVAAGKVVDDLTGAAGDVDGADTAAVRAPAGHPVPAGARGPGAGGPTGLPRPRPAVGGGAGAALPGQGGDAAAVVQDRVPDSGPGGPHTRR